MFLGIDFSVFHMRWNETLGCRIWLLDFYAQTKIPRTGAILQVH